MNSTIYLDYNAGAPPWPEVVEAVTDAMGGAANASSIHRKGRAARAIIEQARERVAALVGADPAQIVFTGSGTEANNQALRTSGRERVLVSAIEHEAVLRACADAEILPVTESGIIDLEALERALASNGDNVIVALMAANNETGIIQPVAGAVRIAHAAGAMVHCDAIQSTGKIPFDIAASGADSFALSAHKIGGPQGVGALVLRDPGGVGRLIHGGGQERGRRAGTENVAGVAGFGVAAEIAAACLDSFGRLAGLRDRMEAAIAASGADCRLIGADVPRLPNTSKIAMPGVTSETQVIAMDLDGIAISAGSACSSGKVELPYVLDAMGVPEEIAISAVRVSLGWATTEAEIDRFVEAWRALAARAGRRAA